MRKPNEVVLTIQFSHSNRTPYRNPKLGYWTIPLTNIIQDVIFKVRTTCVCPVGTRVPTEDSDVITLKNARRANAAFLAPGGLSLAS